MQRRNMVTLDSICSHGSIDPERVLDLCEAGRCDEVLALDSELSGQSLRIGGRDVLAVAGHGRLTGSARRKAARGEGLVLRLVTLLKPKNEQLPTCSNICLPEMALKAIGILVNLGASLQRAAWSLEPFCCGALSCLGDCPGTAWHMEARRRLIDLSRIAHGAGRGAELFIDWNGCMIAAVALSRNCTVEVSWLQVCSVRPHEAIEYVSSKLRNAEERLEYSHRSLESELNYEDKEVFFYLNAELDLLRASTFQLQTWQQLEHFRGKHVERMFQFLGHPAKLIAIFFLGQCYCPVCVTGGAHLG
eukprot:TRINITY_DN71153_c0_g1_i1.p1 TRINITY_DN71153_c0_g1~~TRINITY_DN71153_c0_g1_i1.p1  ORF type:complete len:304 (+),score=18.02 TRINITY_DN71153_c0_g1_i1:60-971(+)